MSSPRRAISPPPRGLGQRLPHLAHDVDVLLRHRPQVSRLLEHGVIARRSGTVSGEGAPKTWRRGRSQTPAPYSRSPAAGACPERCLASGAENDRPDQPRDDQGERRNACPPRRHPRVPLGAEPCPRSGDPCGRCNRPHHELHAHGGSVTLRRERRQLAGLASVYARRGGSPAASRASASLAKFRHQVALPSRNLIACHNTSSKGAPPSMP
jgi:hypothetical protein